MLFSEGYHPVLHGKLVVPIVIFSNAEIVPALRIPFHRGLLPVANGSWFVFFDIITTITRRQDCCVLPKTQALQPQSTAQSLEGHPLPIPCSHRNTGRLEF